MKFTFWQKKNPCPGQTRWIERGRHADVRAEYKYAIGYEGDSCHRRHYKILRFIDAKIQEDFLLYETTDFGSSSWMRQRFNGFRGIKFFGRGVSLKGNTYWCATDSLKQIAHTVCFDFTRMRFRGLQTLPFPHRFEHLVILSLIRLMNKRCCGAKNMFSTFIRKISDGGFFVEEEKKLAMSFGKDRDKKLDTVKIFGVKIFGANQATKNQEPSDKECSPLVCPYVPSFVQIKPHKSSSEKR
ncbi:unnamed protein product, partial [Brassica napus]